MRSEPFGSTPTAREPSLADVKAFVAAAASPSPTPALQGEAQPAALEVPAEVQDFVTKKMQAVDPQLPEPDIPVDSVAMPDFVTQDKTRSEMLAGPGVPVQVTDSEKDIYCKAVLFDHPVVWNIPVLGGAAAVSVRSLSVRHEDIILRWMTHLETTQRVTSTSLWLTWYKRASTILRTLVLTANNKTVFEVDHSKLDELLDAKVGDAQLFEQLGSLIDQAFQNMKPARYEVLMEAVTLHERKLNVCNRAAASGNFWSPAGTV